MAERVSHSLVKALRRVPDFATLDEATLLQIVGVSMNLLWPAGSMVFEKDSASEALYIVLSGQVEIFEPADSREIQTARVGPGQSFGELSILLHTRHTRHARAGEDSELMVVPKESFEDLLEQQPQLAAHFRRRLSERLPAASGDVPASSEDPHNP